MARIRSVHPAICTSENLVDLPAELERTYVRLWTHLDDEGRAKDNPRLIKAAIYPLHDDMTADVVDEHLGALAARGHLVRYFAEGESVVAVPAETWKRWQKPQKPRPSTLPEPSDTPTGLVASVTRTGPVGVGDEQGPVVVVVVGEGVVEGGEGANVSPRIEAVMAPGCPPDLIDEATEVVLSFCDTYPPADVDAALVELIGQRRRFPFASNLRTALSNLLGPAPAKVASHPLDESQRAQYAEIEVGLDRVRSVLDDSEPDPEVRRRGVEERRAARRTA